MLSGLFMTIMQKIKKWIKDAYSCDYGTNGLSSYEIIKKNSKSIKAFYKDLGIEVDDNI